MASFSTTRLGRYEIRSQLGAGGMGEVFLAWDTELERTVALKMLHADVASDQQRMRRFVHEARASSALNHPNILTIYEIGQADSARFIATEFIDGETLRQHMQSARPKLSKVLDIALQVASALAAAHEAGIIHRDIKPENVMLRRDGIVKVLDFGLAKLTEQVGTVDTQAPTRTFFKTAPGMVMGTVLYMSPEQARGLTVDARTDIWSLGVVLYELVAGRLPYEGTTTTDIMVSILEREPPPLSRYAPEVPTELQRIISKALRKACEERYQTVKDLLQDLKDLKQELEFAAKLERSTPSALNKGAMDTRSSDQPMVAATMKPLIVLLASGLLIGLIVIAGYYFWSKRSGQSAPSTSYVAPSQQRLISTFPGSHAAASFSPDGNRIAFVSEVDGVSQVWVKSLTEGDPVQLTSDEAPASRPRWSPAGDEIVYVRRLPGKVSIYAVSPEGGTPRKIIEGGRNPNWSGDGKRLVFERDYDVWTTNRDGSDQRRIDGVPPTDFLAADRMPAFSPDGSAIALFQNDKGPIGDYWVVPVSGGEARRLTFDHIYGGAPAWTPDGRFIIFPSQRAGSMTLWRVPVDGGRSEPVLMSAGEDTEPEISRDGRKLIYTNTRNSHILMLTDAATLQSRELKESRVDMVDPSFSPDGSRIVFFGVNQEGDIHIHTIGADGKNLAQVTRGKKERNVHPQWSADGSSIYFYQFHPTVSFRKISVQGGESAELVQGWEWGTHNGARVDPQGKRIIYSKIDRGFVAATMIRDIATGTETAFSLPLRHARWSHDGQFIVGTDVPGRNWKLAEISICAVEGDACRKVTNGYSPHWSHNDTRIYFFPFTDSDGESLWAVSREGGDERKIMDLRPLHPIGQFFDVSSQGQIVWMQYRRGKNELWLVDLSHQ
ncbi:MAG: protein kinase [Pyrinomonadaceae bacterium]|nr:protein kinase [Pyrinomonadaceae bacterium]